MIPDKSARAFNHLLGIHIRVGPSRRIWLLGTVLVITVLLFLQARYLGNDQSVISSAVVLPPRPYLDATLEGTSDGSFQPLLVNGFDNTGIPGGEYLGRNLSCASLSYSAGIGVQRSFFLEDDLVRIAADLDTHPMINYAPAVAQFDDGSYNLTQIVTASWDRLATACVFLSRHHVHLCVSRIIFHPGRAKDHAKINFLRGQIYSEQWVHLDHYALKWQDQEIQFPKVFDTATEYHADGQLFGPEDARIIIEEGVEDPEPVIIFNMVSSKSDWRRAMYIFRPFSETSQILTVRGKDRLKKEKNWAPFFLTEARDDSERASQYIHFVYWLAPLTVLKCELATGMCDVVFEQMLQAELVSTYDLNNVSLRGGTQFVPVPVSKRLSSAPWGSTSNVQAFISFPRHHVEHMGGCLQPAYRPEMMVLLTNTTHFYLSYGSGPLDFGPDIVMSAAGLADACGAGRIMIANNIAHWNMDAQDDDGDRIDIMTLTVSVDDATVQVLRLAGIWDFLRGVPSLARYFSGSTTDDGQSHFPVLDTQGERHRQFAEALQPFDVFERANAVGFDIQACIGTAAMTYTDKHSTIRLPGHTDKSGGDAKLADPSIDKPKNDQHKGTSAEETDEKIKAAEQIKEKEAAQVAEKAEKQRLADEMSWRQEKASAEELKAQADKWEATQRKVKEKEKNLKAAGNMEKNRLKLLEELGFWPAGEGAKDAKPSPPKNRLKRVLDQ